MSEDDPPRDGEQSESETDEESVLTQAKPYLVMVGKALAVAAVMVIIGAALYGSVLLFGIVATIVYVMLFLMGATMIPLSVYMGLPKTVGSVRGPLGKIHMILGQVSFGVGYLVQDNQKYQMCPGTRDAYYYDGDWYDISGGQENLTILGLRPFGFIRHKDEETLRNARVDPDEFRPEIRDIETADVESLVSDGGEVTGISRGGFQEIKPQSLTHPWIIDLKRYYSRGMQRIGDIKIIEDTEDIAEKQEAEEGTMDRYGPMLGMVAGLMIGVMTGLIYFMVMG